MLQPLNILTLLFTIAWCCATVLGAPQKIDNTSPEIQYTGAWSMSNTPGDGDFGNTLAFSQDNLDTAKLQFSGAYLSVFHLPIYRLCTSVTVFGALKPVGTWNMHSAYYLDDSSPVGFIPNPLVASEQHQVTFYSSGPLRDGPHTLTIVNMGQQFWFDFIAVETSASTTTTTKTATVPNQPPGTVTLPSPVPHTTTSTSPIQTASSVLPPTVTSTITSTSSSTISRSSSTLTLSSSAIPTTSVSSSNSNETTSNTTRSPASSNIPTQSSLTPTSNPDTTNGIATTSSYSSTSSTSATPTSTGIGSAHTLPLGEIIGIAAGGAALILALALAFFALWRRRRRIAARAAISPFDPEDDSDGTPSPPPDYWPSEKGSAIDRARLSVPVQLPARQMLVITHGDHAGGMWADYQSSMPTPSGYHASESSSDGDLKALRADLARRAKRPAAACVAPESRGVPF
ncbi:hypothetical protein VTO73DRAFT_12188 [Trametes versicolor]